MKTSTWRSWGRGPSMLMGLACVLLSCTRAGPSARTITLCPRGVSHGTGMVAAALCATSHDATCRIRQWLEDAAPEALRHAPGDDHFDPHITVCYGVKPEGRDLLTEMPYDQDLNLAGMTFSFGELTYWDDLQGEKTSLVAPIVDRSFALQTLHDRLVASGRLATHPDFMPHLTLATLRPGARLDAALARSLDNMLGRMALRVCALYLTDLCGAPLTQQRLDVAGTSGDTVEAGAPRTEALGG